MRTNYHTHTTRCMHATGDDEEYVLSAIKGGYRILGFSDHTPWKYRTDYVADMRMLPEELPGYVESLKTLREKYHDRIDIRIGLECEYFPQYIHWLKEQIKKYQLDYIIFGNHHYHTDEKFPYFGHHTDSRDMLDLYEESAIEGMESGLFSCLAHPDLFMRSYPKFDHHCTTISRHICRAAARLHVPLEYNIGYVATMKRTACPPTHARSSGESLPMKAVKLSSDWTRTTTETWRLRCITTGQSRN